MIETAIADAIPHDGECPGETGRCVCGAVARRNVLYVRVQAHVHKLTAGRVYLDGR